MEINKSRLIVVITEKGREKKCKKFIFTITKSLNNGLEFLAVAKSKITPIS